MEPYKEEKISRGLQFPMDVFIQDNIKTNVTVEPHWHDCFEILYMLEGSAEQQVNDKRFKVAKHDVVILYDGDIHSTYCSEGADVKILVIKFLPELIDSSYRRVLESGYIVAFLNNRGSHCFHLEDTSKNSIDINALMMGIYEEFINKEVGYEIYITGYIYQFIACLVRSKIINLYGQFDKDLDKYKLDKLFNYIESNYRDKITLKCAADLLNFSEAYFSRCFKRITGRTFKEYLDFVRICEVEKVILSGKMNISQAAYEAGFCNVSSFNRVFKRVRGYLPGDIIKSNVAKK